MDPASLALTCFQVSGLAVGVSQLTRALWTLSRDKGEIGRDIRASLRRLKLTMEVITGAVESLRTTVKKYPECSAVQYIANKGLVRAIGRDAEHIGQKLKRLGQNIKSMSMFRKAQWVLFMKKNVEAVIPLTSSIQLLLHSAYISILLEIIESQTRTQLTDFLAVIRDDIRTQAEHTNASLRTLIRHELRNAGETLFGTQKPLSIPDLAVPMQHLMNTLRETGSVPKGTSSASSRRTRSTRISANSSSLQAITSPLTPPSSDPSTPPDLEHIDSVVEQDALSESSEIGLSRSSSPAGEMTLADLGVIHHSTLGLSSENMNASRGSLDELREHETFELTGSGVLVLPEGTDRPAISGFVSPNASWQHRKDVTARRDNTLPVNLISLGEASKLDLIVLKLGGLSRVNFGGHSSTKVVGIVRGVSWWSQGKRVSERVEVSFWVCEHLRERLILGRPYFEAENKLRR